MGSVESVSGVVVVSLKGRGILSKARQECDWGSTPTQCGRHNHGDRSARIHQARWVDKLQPFLVPLVRRLILVFLLEIPRTLDSIRKRQERMGGLFTPLLHLPGRQERSMTCYTCRLVAWSLHWDTLNIYQSLRTHLYRPPDHQDPS